MFVLVATSMRVQQAAVMRWVYFTTVNKVQNSGLYYKHIMVTSNDSRVVSK
jgi:hypothetical protein